MSAAKGVVSGTQLQCHRRQRGNPLLKHVSNVPVAFVDGLVADYAMGRSACAVFVSVRYHVLHPKHAVRRISEVGRAYTLRVLLVLVDKEDCEGALEELNAVALLNDFTLMLAWSYAEAARYLETFKAYENKGSESIHERVDEDPLSQLTSCLTKVRAVNKTDAMTLASGFGSMADIIRATEHDLQACPGLGPVKVHRLLSVFQQPFYDAAPPDARDAQGAGPGAATGSGSAGAGTGAGADPEKQGGGEADEERGAGEIT